MNKIKVAVMIPENIKKSVEAEAELRGCEPQDVVNMALYERYKSTLEPKRPPGRPAGATKETKEERYQREYNLKYTCPHCGGKRSEWSAKQGVMICPDCEADPPDPPREDMKNLLDTCPDCGGVIGLSGVCQTCGEQTCGTCGGALRWDFARHNHTCDTCTPTPAVTLDPGYNETRLRVPLKTEPPDEPDPMEKHF